MVCKDALYTENLYIGNSGRASGIENIFTFSQFLTRLLLKESVTLYFKIPLHVRKLCASLLNSIGHLVLEMLKKCEKMGRQMAGHWTMGVQKSSLEPWVQVRLEPWVQVS